MSEIERFVSKRVFYFNITYGCNSVCMFCYSHNTKHNSVSHNDIDINEFFRYVSEKNITSRDRIIINGGEPLLHPNIEDILNGLSIIGCEVLVYTNGRLLSNNQFANLNSNIRFIIPIHGFEQLHDQITGVRGSFRETIKGLNYLVDNTKCAVDVKLIINPLMAIHDARGLRTIEAFENEIKFNDSVHITKMADTIISLKNNCDTVTDEIAAEYTKIFYNYFSGRNIKVKMFDTCIRKIDFLENCEFKKYDKEIEVFFKDLNQNRELILTRDILPCMDSCAMASKCISAVNEYKVLEVCEQRVYENLE